MRAIQMLSWFGVLLGVDSPSIGAQNAPIPVSGDSLGALAFWVPLAQIVEQMPNSKRAVFRGVDAGYPALEFRMGVVRVWAVQEREPAEGVETLPELDLASPADFFVLRGTGAALRDGAQLGARWSELQPTLGRVVIYAEPGYPIHVRPCKYPWLVVGFAARLVKRRADGTIPPTSVPASARADYFQVIRRKGAVPTHPRCAS